MDIEIEDFVFLILIFGIFGLSLYTSSVLGSVIPSLIFLWISLSLLIITHTYIYIKKKRDMKIEKIRYLFSIFPMYLILIYLTNQELSGHIRSMYDNILIFGIVLVILILNGVFENFLKRRK
jgi:hypothetical protein